MIIQHLANLPSACPTDSSTLESCISALKTSISTLESSIKASDGSSGSWETFGWLCAVAVSAGIAGEVFVIVSEYRDDLEDWRRGIVRPPDRPPSWRFWFDIVATIVVLTGVFGEAKASRAISTINSLLRSKTSELRAKSDRLLTVIKEVAGDAAKSAKNAHDEADAVKAEAIGIDADLARTQYLLSGRSITDRASLVAGLKKYKGAEVHFSSYNSEPDESALCGDLKSAAKDAEMDVSPQDFCGRVVQVGSPNTGVVVSGPDAQQTMALGQIILHTCDVGLGGVVSGIKNPELTIFVGAKPPFRVGQARGFKAPAKAVPQKKKIQSAKP